MLLNSNSKEALNSKISEKCQFEITEAGNLISLSSTYLHNSKVSTANYSKDKNLITSSILTQLSDIAPRTFVKATYQPQPPYLCPIIIQWYNHKIWVKKHSRKNGKNISAVYNDHSVLMRTLLFWFFWAAKVLDFFSILLVIEFLVRFLKHNFHFNSSLKFSSFFSSEKSLSFTKVKLGERFTNFFSASLQSFFLFNFNFPNFLQIGFQSSKTSCF